MAEGYVYLLAAGSPCVGHYKIGKADNPQRRLKQLIKMPFDITLAHAILCEDAFAIELMVHEFYSAHRANGEWFLLDDEQVSIFTSCANESDIMDIMGGPQQKLESNKDGILVSINEHLDKLQVLENQKPLNQRRSVPALAEIARLTSINRASLYNMAAGKYATVNLEHLAEIINALRSLDFPVTVADLLAEHPASTVLSPEE